MLMPMRDCGCGDVFEVRVCVAVADAVAMGNCGGEDGDVEPELGKRGFAVKRGIIIEKKGEAVDAAYC